MEWVMQLCYVLSSYSTEQKIHCMPYIVQDMSYYCIISGNILDYLSVTIYNSRIHR